MLAALALYWPTSTPNLMRVGIMHPPPVFSRDTPAVEQYLVPRMGTPARQGFVASELAARLVFALPLGSAAYRADVMAAVAHAVAVALLLGIAWRVSGGAAGALVAGLAMAMSASFWPRAVVVSSQSIVALVVMSVLWILVRGGSTQGPRARWLTAAVFGVGVGGNPELLLLAPGLLWWVARDAGELRRRMAAAIPIALGAALGLAHYGMAVASQWSGASRFSKIGAVASPELAMALSRGLLPGEPLEGASATVRVFGMVTEEFGALGLALIAVGFWRLAATRRDVAIGLGAMTAGGFGWALVTGAGTQQVALPPVLWVAYPVLACGVAWLLEVVGSRPGWRAVAIGMACVLPVTNGLRQHEFATRLRHRQAFRADHLQRVLAIVPHGATVVAESEAFDRALIWADLDRGNEPIVRIPSGGTAASLARSTGAEVFAFDAGVEGSRPRPFHWSHRAVAPIELSLNEYVELLPKGTLVAVGGASVASTSGRAGSRRLDAIGGRLDLAGGTPVGYGIVGVRGGARPVVERLGSAAADVRVRAGDPVSPDGAVSPVTIGLSAGNHGVRIIVNGREAVSAAGGLAVVAVNPLGSVIGAYIVESGRVFDTRWRLEPEPYRLD